LTLHVAAPYGLPTRGAWSASLTGYLAATGIGIASYGLLLALTGLDPFGATSALPSARAWAEGVGLMVWMMGLWVVAARFAFKGVPSPTPHESRATAVGRPATAGIAAA